MEQELTSRFDACYASAKLNVRTARDSLGVDNTKCQTRIEIGVFFDGTDNNLKRDLDSYGDTNVARLYHAYHGNETPGSYKAYVPGVGTIFPEIGEVNPSGFGNAFGSGCNSRILFALLWTLDAVSKHTSGNRLFTARQLKGLCTSKPTTEDIAAIRTLGVEIPLASETAWSHFVRTFLGSQVERLRVQVADNGMEVQECALDVFGFSRGAAEARVFCSWLYDLTTEDKIGDIPLTFRFLGLFDTVASAGARESIGNAIVNSTGGHVDWARSDFLRISQHVKRCVHMVAMHELRKNFPLDEVSVDGVVPANCIEVAYPGAHSDVGGGYKPGQLGIATAQEPREGDSRKLSQITLRHMFQYAQDAGVPLVKKEEARLTVHPDVDNALKRFLELSGPGSKKLSDWMAPYLAWRWQVRKQYSELLQVKNATAADRELLLGGNETLVADANHIYLRGDEEKASKFVSLARIKKKFDLKNAEYRQDEISALDPEAPHVLACAKAHPPIPPALAEFFDLYVHDSLAGFRKDLKEPTGYWRYRRSFRGSEAPELTQSDEPTKMPRTA